MIVLKDILYGVSLDRTVGDTAVALTKIEYDSRKVGLNDVFVAVKGTAVDGHDFIKMACDKGAIAIICERLPDDFINGITYVQVADTQRALAIMAGNYYQNPSRSIKLVGITGTNGKTTIATLLYQLFTAAGYETGLLSTVRVMIGKQAYPATHTTPDPLAINDYLRIMSDHGVEYCFMEVSSHGIHQQRTAGLHFVGGIFSNLSHDHLDYHKTFAEYRDVKKKFFDQLPRTAFALTNTDDKNGQYMLQNSIAKRHSYALKSYADYKAQILENQFDGLLLKIDNHELWVNLIGSFNAYNMLAVYGASDLLGLENLEVLKLMSQLKTVAGRFQHMLSEAEGITAIVDYAHTPDALKNVLQTINDIRTGNEQLISVVGCGGDRDREKRPKMAAIAAKLSNKVVFTSDNPRSEDPDAIIREMESGVSPEDYKKTLSVTDRREAIKTACVMAQAGDIILVAGKGHETYQEINGKRSEFDDFKVTSQMLKALNK